MLNVWNSDLKKFEPQETKSPFQFSGYVVVFSGKYIYICKDIELVEVTSILGKLF